MKIFTLWFEEGVPSLYNESKNQENIRMEQKIYFSSKNYLQFRKNFKGILFFCKHKPEIKTDDMTEILGWKVFLCEMGNEALNTLVHHSIDKHLIKEEKGMILNFLWILLSVKILLGMY